jgi:DNA sulfur modification protein DndB
VASSQQNREFIWTCGGTTLFVFARKVWSIFQDSRMDTCTSPFVSVIQHKRTILLTKLRADVLTEISYVAVRGQTNEQGAVQRVLNQRRIAGIKDFTLGGGDYPGAIVLNWVNEQNPLKKNGNQLSFEIESGSTQIVDGQHRVAGIRAAIAVKKEVGDLELCVAIYENLKTQECADIFLSINTEQKPVDRSLVFDLYGIASESIVDKGLIKLPGAPRRKGGIALSTVVAAIKPLVEEKGNLEQLGVKELEGQKQIILNLFQALSEKYGDAWDDNNNVFQYAAGFVGAIEFLKSKLIPYCNTKRSFEKTTISHAVSLNAENLLRQSDVKGMAGGEASNRVFSRLVEVFSPDAATGSLKY